MRVLCAAASWSAMAFVLAPLAARAAGSGPELGVRIAYSLPFGDTLGLPPDLAQGGGVPLGESVSGSFPLQADLGYRFNPYLYAGLYGSYALALPQNCPASTNCSAHGLRLGVNVQVHPGGDVPVDPWFGIGAGYEWLSVPQNAANSYMPFDAQGFELLNLQVGIDFELSPAVKLGPVAALSVAQYQRMTVRGVHAGENDISYDVTDKKLHEWVVLGVRMTFLP